MIPARTWLLALALPLAACAEAPTPPAASPAAKPAAPPVTREMSVQEWDKARDAGTYTPTELPRLGESRELHGPGAPSSTPLPPGAVRIASCQPGGSSEGFWIEKATGALWKLRTTGGLSVPRGVSISATRCFESDHQLPAGKTIAGVLTVSYPNHIGDH